MSDLIERIEKAIERVEQVRLHQPGGHLGLSNDTYTLLSSVLADCLTTLSPRPLDDEELEKDYSDIIDILTININNATKIIVHAKNTKNNESLAKGLLRRMENELDVPHV